VGAWGGEEKKESVGKGGVWGGHRFEEGRSQSLSTDNDGFFSSPPL